MEDHMIIVPNSSVAKQAAALTRYAMTAVGAYALGRGYVAADTMALISVILVTVLPGAYGIYETWRSNEQKKALAEHAPNGEIKK